MDRQVDGLMMTALITGIDWLVNTGIPIDIVKLYLAFITFSSIHCYRQKINERCHCRNTLITHGQCKI